MTKEEFEARTGASVTAEEYAGIEQIYILNEKNHNTGLINAELTEKQDGIIDFLLGNPDASAMRRKAIELLGDEREYIRRKCERSLPLDDEDKAAILRLL